MTPVDIDPTDTFAILNAAGDAMRALLEAHDLSTISIEARPGSFFAVTTHRPFGRVYPISCEGQGQTAHDALLDALDQRDEARELAA